MTNETEQDQIWIKRCLLGETRCFGKLVERYERMVRTVIYRLIDDDFQIEELAQQTFITAFENLGQYAGKSKFSTWLCQIALNKARDFLRSARKRRQDVDVSRMHLAEDKPGPDTLVNGQQREYFLKSALSRLRESDRELIVLKYLCEYDYMTIATMLHCTKEAAKVRSLRARGALRGVLEDMGVQL